MVRIVHYKLLLLRSLKCLPLPYYSASNDAIIRPFIGLDRQQNLFCMPRKKNCLFLGARTSKPPVFPSPQNHLSALNPAELAHSLHLGVFDSHYLSWKLLNKGRRRKMYIWSHAKYCKTI